MELYVVEERHTTMYQPLGFYREWRNAAGRFILIEEYLKNQYKVSDVDKKMTCSDKKQKDLLQIMRCGREIYRIRKIQTED